MANLDLHGLLLIKKPVGWTSFDVVWRLRTLMGRGFKIGHAGTLDPFATGLLIMCLGRGTKLVPLLADVEKAYRVQVKFGELTNTLDKTGSLLEVGQIPENLELHLVTAVERLGKYYEQKPPVYSALKHEGVPLYALAREGLMATDDLDRVAQMKSRWIAIFEMLVEKVDHNFVTLFCRVSKGAYIRSLADDLAQKIGLRATTYELDRTSIGPFTLEDAYDLKDFNTAADIERCTIPLEEARMFILTNGSKKCLKQKFPGVNRGTAV